MSLLPHREICLHPHHRATYNTELHEYISKNRYITNTEQHVKLKAQPNAKQHMHTPDSKTLITHSGRLSPYRAIGGGC